VEKREGGKGLALIDFPTMTFSVTGDGKKKEEGGARPPTSATPIAMTILETAHGGNKGKKEGEGKGGGEFYPVNAFRATKIRARHTFGTRCREKKERKRRRRRREGVKRKRKERSLNNNNFLLERYRFCPRRPCGGPEPAGKEKKGKRKKKKEGYSTNPSTGSKFCELRGPYDLLLSIVVGPG